MKNKNGKTIKVVELKPRKGQKCHLCGKEIKGSWCYNGFWFCAKCKEKDTKKRIKDYLKKYEPK